MVKLNDFFLTFTPLPVCFLLVFDDVPMKRFLQKQSIANKVGRSFYNNYEEVDTQIVTLRF